MNNSDEQVKEILTNRLENASNLEKNVINILLNQEDIIKFIYDVTNHGCSSGIVTELITYEQTEMFFIENMEDIFELLNQYLTDYGQVRFYINANNLAWFGFESVCINIISDCELLFYEVG